MTAPNLLDCTVALLVGWASLTAIFEPSRGATAQCDAPYVTQVPLAAPTEAELAQLIQDMKLHD